MEVILYDPKDPVFKPTHVFVVDAFKTREAWEKWTARERLHAECLAGVELVDDNWPEYRKDEVCTHDARCPRHKIYPCAACDWKSPEVRAIRAKKLAKLNAFIRTGKFPPGWLKTEVGVSRIPKMLTDEEARRTVFPPMFRNNTALTLLECEKFTKNVAARYLQAMGEKKLGEEWSCGCVIYRDCTGAAKHEGPQVGPCKKHERAFKGREED